MQGDGNVYNPQQVLRDHVLAASLEFVHGAVFLSFVNWVWFMTKSHRGSDTYNPFYFTTKSNKSHGIFPDRSANFACRGRRFFVRWGKHRLSDEVLSQPHPGQAEGHAEEYVPAEEHRPAVLQQDQGFQGERGKGGKAAAHPHPQKEQQCGGGEVGPALAGSHHQADEDGAQQVGQQGGQGERRPAGARGAGSCRTGTPPPARRRRPRQDSCRTKAIPPGGLSGGTGGCCHLSIPYPGGGGKGSSRRCWSGWGELALPGGGRCGFFLRRWNGREPWPARPGPHFLGRNGGKNPRGGGSSPDPLLWWGGVGGGCTSHLIPGLRPSH